MTSTDTTHGTTGGGTDRRRWFALAIVMTAAFMDLVDVTIVNIAIPSIQREAGASFARSSGSPPATPSRSPPG